MYVYIKIKKKKTNQLMSKPNKWLRSNTMISKEAFPIIIFINLTHFLQINMRKCNIPYASYFMQHLWCK